ncbi:MAG: DUF4111 domain-containing protein, partial [Actinomycetota bacterium]|nr:DUF4111 domain-containing protein [Actinomycetota bacterium]
VRGYVDELACAGVEEGAAGRSLRVLDLARSLYTLAHRRPVSKVEAARWLAREQPGFARVVEAALQVWSGSGGEREAVVVTSEFAEFAAEARRLAGRP